MSVKGDERACLILTKRKKRCFDRSAASACELGVVGEGGRLSLTGGRWLV